jgi:hypothetical protein
MNHKSTIMKKYTLKPGLHQFAPGSAAIHSNDILTDEEAEWYLQRYPHITGLFVSQPAEAGFDEIKDEAKKKRKRIKRVDSSTSPSGGEGGI